MSRRRFVASAAAGTTLRGKSQGAAGSAKKKDAFVPAVTTAHPNGQGFLTARMRLSVGERLCKINLDDILAPYTHRPGAQEWAGEHVGKFLHSASLSLRHAPNAKLKQRLDYAAQKLMASQLPDGYLGTYSTKKHWTSWDVWSHKYNILGLLAYHELTGKAQALAVCRKVGDLLCRTFGTGPGQLDIVSEAHSTHMGMASTSVLEPMVLLHRATGEPRYLEFCRYIVAAWEQPHGPKLLSSLSSHGNVFKTANAKAYEMLSNIVGMAELHRTTGDPVLLGACNNAWTDIVKRRHYPIGTTSWAEHFQADNVLTPGGSFEEAKFVAAGEGCVTVTWLQLNWQLLRDSGDPRYADVIERIAYNALIGAQSPETAQISYFSPLAGRKRYGEVNHGITPDVCCCASSQPRGIALLASMMAGTLQGQPAVMMYEPAVHSMEVATEAGQQQVTLVVTSTYPQQGTVRIAVQPRLAATFSLNLRVPGWAVGFKARVDGRTYEGVPGQYLAIERTWRLADEVEVEMPMTLRTNTWGLLPGVVVERGPQVLATDEDISLLGRLPRWGWKGDQLYKLDRKIPLLLVPFSDAGQSRAEYNVVLPGA